MRFSFREPLLVSFTPCASRCDAFGAAHFTPRSHAHTRESSDTRKKKGSWNLPTQQTAGGSRSMAPTAASIVLLVSSLLVAVDGFACITSCTQPTLLAARRSHARACATDGSKEPSEDAAQAWTGVLSRHAKLSS